MTSIRLADDDDAVGRSDGDSAVRGDGDGGRVPAGLGRDEGGAEGPRDVEMSRVVARRAVFERDAARGGRRVEDRLRRGGGEPRERVQRRARQGGGAGGARGGRRGGEERRLRGERVGERVAPGPGAPGRRRRRRDEKRGEASSSVDDTRASPFARANNARTRVSNAANERESDADAAAERASGGSAIAPGEGGRGGEARCCLRPSRVGRARPRRDPKNDAHAGPAARAIAGRGEGARASSGGVPPRSPRRGGVRGEGGRAIDATARDPPRVQAARDGQLARFYWYRLTTSNEVSSSSEIYRARPSPYLVARA